jgi:hypothetical protein
MFGTRRCQRGNQNQEEFEDAKGVITTISVLIKMIAMYLNIGYCCEI